MSFAPESSAPSSTPLAKPEVLLRVPVGLASPLWGLFAGAAMSGAAWWWMTRWTRPQNLEAMFGAAARAEAAVEPEMAALAAPVVEAVEAAVEAAPEPVLDAAIEASPEPALEAVADAVTLAEALIEAPVEFEAVGGESAPISPVLEAFAPGPVEAEAETEAAAGVAAVEASAPTPKPKKKAAEPKPA